MEIVALLAVGVALGLALGLFGGGGGILAVPLLLAIGVPTDEAATTSLVVVGVGAIGGLIPNARVGRVAWREGVTFGALGIAGAILGSQAALLAPEWLKLWGFALLLVVSGTLMLRRALAPPVAADDRERRSWLLVVLVALVVGLVTGFFGVGGGFLIVPALTLVMGMAVHRATATALLVIIINSTAALLPRAGEALDPKVAAIVAITTLITGNLAARWSNKWSSRALGIGFGSLVLAMSLLIAWEALNAG